MAVFHPPGTAPPHGALIFLGGLGDTWREAAEKSGLQHYAARHRLLLICPDTSPRGTGLPGEAGRLGEGASFYVDARTAPWSPVLSLQKYLQETLPDLCIRAFDVPADRIGISGFSMGGHGALITALAPGARYRSVSALAPIADPMLHPIGKAALTAYLGPPSQAWDRFRSVALAASRPENAVFSKILVTIGADDRLMSQLQPRLFVSAAERSGLPVTYHEDPGYDHSWYYVASRAEDHVAHHVRQWTT